MPEQKKKVAPLVGLEPTTLRLTAACSTDWAKEDHIFFHFTRRKKINPYLFVGVKTDFVFLQWCRGWEFYLHPRIHRCKWWIRDENFPKSTNINGFLCSIVGLLTVVFSTDWAKEDHIFFHFTRGKKIHPCPFVGAKINFVFLQWIRGEKQKISLDIYGKRAFRNYS